jgi:hypothetical protein
MSDQDLTSRAEMVRSPMAPIAALNPPPSQDREDPVELVLRPYAALLERPVPEHLRALVESADPDVWWAARNP